MARYMLVANQTLQSPELRDAALQLQADDEAAELVVVVPATRVVHGLVWDEVETKEVARSRLEAGMRHLRAEGCRVVDGLVGDEDPVLAVEDELRRRRYAGVVISTLPAGLSRWIKLDVVSRVKRRFGPGRPVVHVIGSPVEVTLSA
ncbi:MAG TPA: hypothetical protein VGK42_01420 [Candidatus Dormibacteraeota bacterium]